jgi:PAS domain S-box-containing protein
MSCWVISLSQFQLSFGYPDFFAEQFNAAEKTCAYPSGTRIICLVFHLSVEYSSAARPIQLFSNLMLFRLHRNGTKSVILGASFLVILIAIADWEIDVAIPLGFLYLLPMQLFGRVLNRWQICIAAAVCTFLTEAFNSLKWTPAVGLPRDILTFAAFSGIGLFVYGVFRSRRSSNEHMQQVQSEIVARQDAEEQLKVLIESSPAAIFTAGENGRLLLANEAAHRLLRVSPGHLEGTSVYQFLPSFANLPSTQHSFRTVMQCQGMRQNGEIFLADVWFSTYQTSVGNRLAAMVIDTSEDLRTHEESSLHQLLSGSRILVSAVSHEIRNVCAAITVVHQNLERSPELKNSRDLAALNTLIQSLEKIASKDLPKDSDRATNVDVHSLLGELRIIVEPSLGELGITLTITEDLELPEVLADRSSLMQVFLNLVKNSERAMTSQPRRELSICARSAAQKVLVKVVDTGCGVTNSDELFKPFQQSAAATGLGLYLSRAFMRSFHGDLRYEPSPEGSSFVVELNSWQEDDSISDG